MFVLKARVRIPDQEGAVQKAHGPLWEGKFKTPLPNSSNWHLRRFYRAKEIAPLRMNRGLCNASTIPLAISLEAPRLIELSARVSGAMKIPQSSLPDLEALQTWMLQVSYTPLPSPCTNVQWVSWISSVSTRTKALLSATSPTGSRYEQLAVGISVFVRIWRLAVRLSPLGPIYDAVVYGASV